MNDPKHGDQDPSRPEDQQEGNSPLPEDGDEPFAFTERADDHTGADQSDDPDQAATAGTSETDPVGLDDLEGYLGKNAFAAVRTLIEEREARIAELEDHWKRAVAETENVRRRAEKDKADAGAYGITKFARDLLAVADNLRRALETVPEDQREGLSEPVKNLIVGVEMTERELHASFEKNGIARIEAARGTKFDPNQHQAMVEVPNPGDVPSGAVVDIYQHGYMIGERLLRPAMVTVAKGEPSAGTDESGSESPDGHGPGSRVDTSA